MAKQDEHGRLIAAAAKAALLPLGFRRKGVSRTWISDQRCWAIIVEFQPSAWEKGTYLNVWPQWLWLRMGGGHMDVRVGDFIPFKSAEQFTPLVETLATQAAERVLELRGQFRTLPDVNRYLTSRISNIGSRIYAAAVTAGLMGDLATARHLFERMGKLDAAGFAPLIKLKAECATLGALLDDPETFRSTLRIAIEEARERLRLLPDPQCLEAMDATTAQ